MKVDWVMKNILLIILILFTTESFAQFFDGEPFNFCTLSNVVYNPSVHGSNPNIQNMWVVTKSDEDYTRYEKAFISERFNDDYSNHTIIGEPTVSYNCHGYINKPNQ